MRVLLIAAGIALANAASWNYDGDINLNWKSGTYGGPLGENGNWCGDNAQSPVDVIPSTVVNEGGNRRIVTNFNTQKGFKVKNTGHGVKVVPKTGAPGANTIGPADFMGDGNAIELDTFGYSFFKQKELDGVDELYHALQFHMHFPSEHAIDGELFSGELHIVHARSTVATKAPGDDQYLAMVIGIMIEEGPAGTPDNAFLQTIIGGGLPANKDDVEESTSVLDVRDMFSGQYDSTVLTDFFRYEGGLTTPPCTEAVHWHLLNPATHKIVASPEQVAAFVAVQTVDGNAINNRPVLPMNNRKLYKNTLTLPTASTCADDTATTATAGLTFIETMGASLVGTFIVAFVFTFVWCFLFKGKAETANKV